MSDFVSHLRFVHNTQIILSLTILYLVGANWTSAPELRRDLEGFLRTTEAVREIPEMPGRLPALVPNMPNHHLVLSAEIADTVGYRVLAFNPRQVWSVKSFPNREAPVGILWQALQDH